MKTRMLKTLTQISVRFSGYSHLRLFFRVGAFLLAGAHAMAAIYSQSMNADGISYLDIGDAYFRGDWENAINPVWSPLYSLILGLANRIFQPSMQWAFPTTQIINFLIFLGTLASFEFMWEAVRITETETRSNRPPDWLWWTLGYLLFIWISLGLIQIWAVTPDMLMAACVFIAAGLIARIRTGEGGWRLFLSLGLILGLGYLSKSFMFAIAPIFIGLAWLVQKQTQASFAKTLLSLGIFVLISLPFILLISEKKGKPTIGEAGTVTYLRYANGMPFPHWQGDPSRNLVPIHPSRIIHQFPTIYEFGEPIGGTYPISTDPSYWYEGISPYFDFQGQMARLFASALVYLDLFFRKQGMLLAAVVAFYAMSQKGPYGFLAILKRWALVIPAVIAFALYGTILVEDRYVGVFVLLFWADILANIQLPADAKNKSWLVTLGLMASIGLLINIILFNLDGFNRLNHSSAPGISEQNSLRPARPLEVAQALQELGVAPGDKVGVIGYAYDSFWARLASVKIVAEMLEQDANDLWRGDTKLQHSALQAFANAGVDVVVAEYVPQYVSLTDWHQVRDSSYYIYLFPEQ